MKRGQWTALWWVALLTYLGLCGSLGVIQAETDASWWFLLPLLVVVYFAWATCSAHILTQRKLRTLMRGDDDGDRQATEGSGGTGSGEGARLRARLSEGAGATGAEEGAGTGLTPYRAWKGASLVYDGAQKAWRFTGQSYTQWPYGVEASARCGRAFLPRGTPLSHDIHTESRAKSDTFTAPSLLACSCGFYSIAGNGKTPPSNYRLHMRGEVLLELEAYGKVVVHEDGYRSTKIRVLSARPSDGTVSIIRCIGCYDRAVWCSPVYGMNFCKRCVGDRISECVKIDYDLLHAQIERDLPTDWRWK